MEVKELGGILIERDSMMFRGEKIVEGLVMNWKIANKDTWIWVRSYTPQVIHKSHLINTTHYDVSHAHTEMKIIDTHMSVFVRWQVKLFFFRQHGR